MHAWRNHFKYSRDPHCSESRSDDEPVKRFVRRNASMVVATNCERREADALFSCGNTGSSGWFISDLAELKKSTVRISQCCLFLGKDSRQFIMMDVGMAGM